MTFPLLLILGCSDSPSSGKASGQSGAFEQDALLGVAVSAEYFTRSVGEEGMGGEFASGRVATIIPTAFASMNMVVYTVPNGNQYLFVLLETNEGSLWQIMQIMPNGDVAPNINYILWSGLWDGWYPVLQSFTLDGQPYIYGQKRYNNDDGTWYFIMKMNPDGSIAGQTDYGGYPDAAYDNAVVIEGDGAPILFGQRNSDGYWYIKEITSEGRLGAEIANGYLPKPANVVPFAVGGMSYLLYLMGKEDDYQYEIISMPGTMGGVTERGYRPEHYDLPTLATYQQNGKTYVFWQGDKHWAIWELVPGGHIGQFCNEGDLDTHYKFVFPLVINPVYMSLSNWMTATYDLIKDRSLHQIAIPGSHDAGMSKSYHCYWGNSCNTQTQEEDMYYQLWKGARYIDFRPVDLTPEDGSGNDWYTGHWAYNSSPGWVGCMGEDIEEALYHISSYLGDMKSLYPDGHKELVIVNFSHGYWTDVAGEGGDLSTDQWSYVINKAYDYLSEYMLDVPPEFDFINSSYEELMRGGGHVIFLVHNDHIPTDWARGIINSNDFDIYNEYSDTFELEHMMNDQFNKLCTAENHKDKLFLLSWTLTLTEHQAIECSTNPDSHPTSILDLTNPALPYLLPTILWNWDNTLVEQHITKTFFPNIIYTDNFPMSTTQAAIYLNLAYDSLEP